MLDAGMAIPSYALNCAPSVLQKANKSITHVGRRLNPNSPVQISSILQTDENGNLPVSKKISKSGSRSLPSSHTSKSLLAQPNTVGVIGGVSMFSTLLFLEKLVRWSLKDGKESIPFVVCSDPTLCKELPPLASFYVSNKNSSQQGRNDDALIVENLKRKMAFLEQSGFHCIITPCHLSHVWLSATLDTCKLPSLNVGDCVASELKEANLKPLETGSNVRIGLLAIDMTTVADFYQERLQNQGFDVVLPDKATMEHIVFPAIQALNKKDKEGARNLLRIAVNVLLVRAVNMVILASDELLSLLPPDDPVLRKCIDPMDALARAAIKWSRSA